MAHSRRVARRPALPAVLVAAMTLSLAACGPDEQVTEAVTDSSTPIATASSGGGGESGSAPATIESAAPVVGTVWVANEDGDSLTAIATRPRAMSSPPSTASTDRTTSR